MKIAFIYDHINRMGGAERILSCLHELYPEAPFYTCVFDAQKATWVGNAKIIPSVLQQIPLIKHKHEWFPGLPFLAFEQLDFSSFDVVLSVTSAEAKTIITPPHTLHICLCLTPTRYLWSHFETYFPSKFIRAFVQPYVSILRLYDYFVSHRPDKYVAISKTVQGRISKYYQRKSTLIYPPIDTDYFNLDEERKREDYFLVVSRLVSYKQIDLVIDACNITGKNLIIVGDGPQEERLKKKVKNANIKFLGRVSDERLRILYQAAQALIFPTEEDFGIVVGESLACGTPVIAYNKGGAAEIINTQTGQFFTEQSVASLTTALLQFDRSKYNSTLCRKRAMLFSQERFKNEVRSYIRKEWEQFHLFQTI